MSLKDEVLSAMNRPMETLMLDARVSETDVPVQRLVLGLFTGLTGALALIADAIESQ